MHRPTLWALVCSASRARILRSLAPGGGAGELVLTAPQPNLRAMLRGRLAPGAAQPVLAEDRAAFAAQIAALLDAHRRAGDLSALVLAAPGGMLAALEAEFCAALRQIVVLEIRGDLVRHDRAELIEAFSRVILGAC